MQALRGIPARRAHRAVPMRGGARLSRTAATLHAEGTCEGTLVAKRRGNGGFGYDPIFVPEGWDETMAELTDEQKDRISHRGRAFRALRRACSPTARGPVPDSR